MKKNCRGFTLLELLIVIAIIGILVSIILISTNTAREKARIAKAKADCRAIYNAIIMLESDTEQWPGHKEAWEVEIGIPNNEICDDGCIIKFSDPEAGLAADDLSPNEYPGWNGPYISASQLVDPWGSEYFFDTDYVGAEGLAVVIGSYGPNGAGLNLYDSDNVYYLISK